MWVVNVKNILELIRYMMREFVPLLILLLAVISCASLNQDAFIYSCRDGDYILMENYIKKGANIHDMGDIGLPPIQAAIFSESIRAVKLLLDKGADPNAVTEDKRSALGLAVNKGNYKIIKLLLDYGADPDLSQGRPPLAEAALNKRLDIVKLLLKYEASVTSPNDTIYPVLMYARDFETAKLLLQHGAGATINNRNSQGMTALSACFAIAPKDPKAALEFVQLLVEHGADVNIEDAKGDTILDLLLLNAEEQPERFNGLVEFMIKNGSQKGSHRWEWERGQ